MSKYSIYYSTRKIMYKELATKWSKWAAESNLTENEIAGIKMFFKSIGIRFGLITEFREIGVI
jgi:hypothetical protein